MGKCLNTKMSHMNGTIFRSPNTPIINNLCKKKLYRVHKRFHCRYRGPSAWRFTDSSTLHIDFAFNRRIKFLIWSIYRPLSIKLPTEHVFPPTFSPFLLILPMSSNLLKGLGSVYVLSCSEP